MSQEFIAEPVADHNAAPADTGADDHQASEDAARDAAAAVVDSPSEFGQPMDPEPAEDGEPPAEPAGAAEPETPPEPAEPPPKKPTRKERQQAYRVGQQQRMARQAERKLQENQTVLNQIAAREAAIEVERRHWDSFERDVRNDPAGALSRRYGISHELLTGSVLDAQSIHPGQRTELDQLKTELAELKNNLTTQQQQAQQRQQQAHHQNLVEEDIQWAVGIADTKDAAEFPFLSALHPALREQLTRAEHAKVMREDPQIHPRDFLDRLDELAEPWVNHIRGQDGNGRQSVQQGTGDPRSISQRAKAPGRVNARAAAEPAGRRELTEEQLRANAIRVAEEASRG
uniref:Uncharacterized protein n=1 Tax=viral metagenome TaxID=1070528 RepID=A0A6M3XAU7_9ZZZZ